MGIKPLHIGIALLLLEAAPAYAREVYKCVVEHGPDHRETIMSDKPCAPNAQTITVRAGAPGPADRAAAHQRLATLEQRQRIEKAIVDDKVLVGMTEDQVIKAWGRPDRKTLSDSAHGSRDQWVYYRNNRTDYVYLDDGEVSSTSSSIDVQPESRAKLMGE